MNLFNQRVDVKEVQTNLRVIHVPGSDRVLNISKSFLQYSKPF